ncbi:MAG TPA: helix-turn-helix transcriptional regulator [Terriglobia bacterium]|nr:helix-turn-helix transcriptional regulator [Terriglobia bacterium]
MPPIGGMANTSRQSSSKSHSLAASVGQRLREVRLQQSLTQADLEKTTGLLRSHISRIETGRRMPSVETLERLAVALKIPVHVLFRPNYQVPGPHTRRRAAQGARAALKQNAFEEKLKEALLHLSEADQRAVLKAAQKMARQASARRKRRDEASFS